MLQPRCMLLYAFGISMPHIAAFQMQMRKTDSVCCEIMHISLGSYMQEGPDSTSCNPPFERGSVLVDVCRVNFNRWMRQDTIGMQ